ncbi:MAG: thiamine-phosphate kinase [Acidimicrobiales bacterium]
MSGPNSGATGPPPGRRRPEGPGRGEFAAIERLRRRLPAAPPGEVWIGDDAAVLDAPRGRLLLATDLAVAGVHADMGLLDEADLGWRALASSVSDIAAMGGRIGHAVVAVAGPPSTDLDRLYDGIAAAAAAFGCPVVGGDLSTARQLVVAVAVTGEVPDGPDAVGRGGARAGDRLFVTGPLGSSAAGLRLLRASSVGGGGGTPGSGPDPAGRDALAAAHRRPVPRLAEGDAARRAGVRAMIDVSDGLAADLGRLADASGVGFQLDAVPIAAGATEEEALGGGEDYELVMAVADPRPLSEAFAAGGLRPPIAIGACGADPARRTLGGRPMAPSGWEHSFTRRGREAPR